MNAIIIEGAIAPRCADRHVGHCKLSRESIPTVKAWMIGDLGTATAHRADDCGRGLSCRIVRVLPLGADNNTSLMLPPASPAKRRVHRNSVDIGAAGARAG